MIKVLSQALHYPLDITAALNFLKKEKEKRGERKAKNKIGK